MPQLPIARTFLPIAFGFALGGAIHVLVMPHLESFAGLAVVVFAAVFLICYLYHQPTQAGGKAAGLALLNMVMGVTNEQTYNFLNVANLAVVLALVFAVLAVATHFPVSFRAEHVFLRLLGRFFRACAYLASALQWDPANPPTRWQRLRRVLHLGDLAELRASSRSGQVCCRRRPWVNPRPSRCRRWSTACKPLPIACKTCLRPARHRNRKCLRANCFPRCARGEPDCRISFAISRSSPRRRILPIFGRGSMRCWSDLKSRSKKRLPVRTRQALRHPRTRIQFACSAHFVAYQRRW